MGGIQNSLDLFCNDQIIQNLNSTYLVGTLGFLLLLVFLFYFVVVVYLFVLVGADFVLFCFVF